MSEPIFQKAYHSLNADQKEAVDEIEGPVLVVAGPGSGKTQLLSLRIVNILRLTDTPANAILALTFTDSAAANMRNRLYRFMGKEASKVAIHTFHSLGTEVINQNPLYFASGFDYKPAEDLDRIQIMENIFQSMELDNPLRVFSPDHGWLYLKDSLSRIQDLKKEGLSPTDFRQTIEANAGFFEFIEDDLADFLAVPRVTQIKEGVFLGFYEKVISFKDPANSYYKHFLSDLEAVKKDFSTTTLKNWRELWCKKDDSKKYRLKDSLNHAKMLALATVYAQYLEAMKKHMLYDFDDMLLWVLESCKQHPDLKYNLEEKYLYILVDEFQDTSGLQLKFLEQFLNLEVSEGRPNLLVVGDDDQSIYKFQGASLANILEFKDAYRGTKIVNLTANYRSNQEILDFSMEAATNIGERLADLEGVNKKLVSMRV